MREVKRHCRILRTSAEHNTSVGITGDISLLNWIRHFAMQFSDKDENSSKMETVNGAIWRGGAKIIREMHNSRKIGGSS